MSPIFTKGLLKGAALAVAGAAALGAGSAFAGPPTACSTSYTSLGSLSTPCTFGAGGNLLFTVTALTTVDPLTDIRFFASGSSLNGFQISTQDDAAQFNYTVSTINNQFFTGLSLVGVGGITSGTAIGGSSFSQAGPGTFNFTTPPLFSDATFGTLNGTFDIASTSAPVLRFTTDVPVPLPVVGAGLAFGFTRKLRKRAKSVA
jgi:hypothetical protein